MPEPDMPWQIIDLTAGAPEDRKAAELTETLARLLELDAGILLIATLPPQDGAAAVPNARTYRFSPPEQIPALRDAAARFAEKHKDA